MRVAIYTAVISDYDELKEPVKQNVECEFFCFTDTFRPTHNGTWRIIAVPRRLSLHPRTQAKRFKLLSHKIFPAGRLAFRYDPIGAIAAFKRRYDATIWIDASLSIKSADFAGDVVSCVGETGWAMFRHPDRDCIFEEAAVSKGMLKYRELPIERQVENYRKLGIQPHSGLFACGVIARKEPLPAVLRRANKKWWAENLRWTYQDQLSLPYVLFSLGTDVDPIPANLWRNDWFDLIPHKSEN